MIVFTPQDYADAVNSIVNNYMYWQLIREGLAFVLVLLVFVVIFRLFWRAICGR